MKRRVKIGIVSLGAIAVVLIAVVVGRAVVVDSPDRIAEPADVEISDADRAVERLSVAIQHPTVSPAEPHDDLTPFVELRGQLEKFYPAFHEAAERRIVGDATLHFTLSGEDPDAPHVVFLAHKDVVPVEPGTEDDWTHRPFSGAVADGFVWGRGTLDNKHNMMALLEAAEFLLERGESPKHTQHFVFGHDEEIGGLEGAKQVADQMADDGIEVAAVYDEGLVITDGIVPGIDGPVALVGISERGYLTVEIEATAEGGHASMPPDELAVARLAEAITSLRENPRPAKLDGPSRQLFEALAPEMGFGYRLLFRNLWLFEPLVVGQLTGAASTNASVRTTAAPTMLRSGERENVLPQKAVATVNFRIHPRDDIDTIMEYLDDVVGGEHVSVSAIGEMHSEPSPVAATDTAGYRAIETAVGEVFGDIPVAPALVVALTDARHFTELTDDVYRFAPVVLTDDDLDRIHGTDERIGVEGYVDLIRYWQQVLGQW